jgi:NADPH2:quinone reductase
MRAFTLDSFNAQPRLRDDIPEPSVGDNEVLVRVHASSVNPVDVFIAAGGLKEMAEYEFPVTLGRDFAGTVEQVGYGVSRYEVGDEVFGFVLHANPTVHEGSWAERITVPEDNQVAAKPPTLDFAHAGAAPLAAIAALAAFDALAPREGETVLVVGAPGGVGSFFVQLAAAAGANVIAPALPEDRDYLHGLGVREVIDRDTRPDGVDAILDVVSFTPDASLLKARGRLASTSALPARVRDASASWPSRRPRTSSASPSSWTPARYGFRSSAATTSSKRVRRSRRCPPRTRRASSA